LGFDERGQLIAQPIDFALQGVNLITQSFRCIPAALPDKKDDE
jgi:hypothetical protein